MQTALTECESVPAFQRLTLSPASQ